MLVALLLAGCGIRPPAEMSDWERENIDRRPVEDNVALPPYPRAANLVEFTVSDPGGFRFFIDAATLAVGKDAIVRYVLVARSAEGAQNVSYEGLRCASADHRVYALGRPDGTWAPARGDWRPLRAAGQRQVALYREYFCPQKQPIRDAAEGVRALRAGGHPSYKAFAGERGI
ncbi:MAG TPA: CNP1-like family protein [Burkholderiales bacterium]|nr:CNP1-like family protein [Burkholderiales bacterium]